MSGTLLGKLALITGAGSGIGRATCQVLAREGANIIAADQNAETAKETIKLISNTSTDKNHFSLAVDVSQSISIKDALKSILGVYNQPPSIIVNCAGITRDNFLLKLSEADFQEVIDVNLKGTFLVMQVFAQALVEKQITGGSIINIASIVGKYGNIGQANYCASKSGVELLTKTAAKEFGQFGIRCNVILPEVAEVIAFLASERSSYVNGASIEVTGGY